MPHIDLPPAIRAFVEATNAGDSDTFVAAFTPDGSVYDWGREFTGRDGVRAWDRTDNIGVQAHFEVLGIEDGAGPDTYVLTARVTGNGYNGTGPLVFQLRDGLVTHLHIG